MIFDVESRRKLCQRDRTLCHANDNVSADRLFDQPTIHVASLGSPLLTLAKLYAKSQLKPIATSAASSHVPSVLGPMTQSFVMVIYSVDMSTLHDSVYFIYFEAADICLVPI